MKGNGYSVTLPMAKLQHDRILSVLRHPKTFSLNELRSLNEKGNDEYFDLDLKSRSCDSSLYQVELEEDGIIFQLTFSPLFQTGDSLREIII